MLPAALKFPVGFVGKERVRVVSTSSSAGVAGVVVGDVLRVAGEGVEAQHAATYRAVLLAILNKMGLPGEPNKIALLRTPGSELLTVSGVVAAGCALIPRYFGMTTVT